MTTSQSGTATAHLERSARDHRGRPLDAGLIRRAGDRDKARAKISPPLIAARRAFDEIAGIRGGATSGAAR
jgi:hypothetical protein